MKRATAERSGKGNLPQNCDTFMGKREVKENKHE